MALLIRTTGEVEPLPDAPLSLADLQRLVGGGIEIVTLTLAPQTGVREVLVVDEAGLLKEKPLNPRASWVAGQTLVGDAVRCHVTHEGQDDEEWR